MPLHIHDIWVSEQNSPRFGLVDQAQPQWVGSSEWYRFGLNVMLLRSMV